MPDHETWEPGKVREVTDVSGLLNLVFDSLADPLARMSCACEECDPAPHETTGLHASAGVIYVEIDGKLYKIQITED